MLNGPKSGRGPLAYWAQCYSLNNWISHWCRFWVFIGKFWCKIHWILQARATNAISYDFIRVMLFLYIERIQHRSIQQWCDWREFKGANLPPDKINAETEPHFAYISVFSTFLVFTNLLWFCVFRKFLDCYFTKCTDNAQHRQCTTQELSFPGRDLFRVLKRWPISQPHTLGLRRGYSDGKAVCNTTGLRRRLHPHWRIPLLQS